MNSSSSVMDTSELVAIIEKIAIFGGLADEQINRVLSLMSEQVYEDGEAIFKRGDTASHIYVITEGMVMLDFEQDDHPLSDISLTQGYCFGETSLIGVQPHIASTYAVEKTRVLVLSGADLYALYESDLTLFSAVILNIAREASRRLHATDELFLRYAQMKDLKKLPYLGF